MAGVKAAVGIIGLFMVWELLVLVIDPADYLFVGPLSAFAELFERPGYFAENTFVTLQEALAGFALGTALGVLCGAALHYSATARSFLYPALIAIDTIPKVALAPLFIVWFGFGFESKAFVAMAIAFFPLVINTYDGLSSVPHELQELARINRASPWKKMVKIDFIYAIPSIFSGAKISISSRWAGRSSGVHRRLEGARVRHPPRQQPGGPAVDVRGLHRPRGHRPDLVLPRRLRGPEAGPVEEPHQVTTGSEAGNA